MEEKEREADESDKGGELWFRETLHKQKETSSGRTGRKLREGTGVVGGKKKTPKNQQKKLATKTT